MNKRAEYTKINSEQEERIEKVRFMFGAMYDMIEQHCEPNRERNLAITKLEEAQFWAIKGISREKSKHELYRNKNSRT